MTVNVGNLNESAVAAENETQYAFRYFACGVPLFNSFLGIMPKGWKVHTFSISQGMPAVLFEIAN